MVLILRMLCIGPCGDSGSAVIEDMRCFWERHEPEDVGLIASWVGRLAKCSNDNVSLICDQYERGKGCAKSVCERASWRSAEASRTVNRR